MNFMLKTIIRNSLGEIITVARSCKGRLKEKGESRGESETRKKQKDNGSKGEAGVGRDERLKGKKCEAQERR